MNAVITIVGNDDVGILAKAATLCAERRANIVDVTQTVLDKYFTMVMLVDITKLTCDFTEFADVLKKGIAEMGLVAHVMHEDIFNSMHRI